MIEKVTNALVSVKDKKWLVGAIAAGIAVAAALISVIVYISKKEEEDCFEEE